jgi:hypothetical protein
MTLAEGKKYLETVLNKDASGNSLNPQEYNIFLKSYIYGFVKEQVLAYRQYVATGAPLDDVVFTAFLIDSLQKQTTETLSSGSFTLPTDMLFLNDLYGTYNAATKKIEIVSPEEYPKRSHNLLSKPISYYPVAYIVGTSCKVFPTNMTAITLDYIAKPTVPVYDYYVDVNYNIVYLAAAATHTLTAGEYGSLGQTSGTLVTSLTTELNLPEEMHMKFFDYILNKVAMRDRDSNLYQANTNEINKEA